MLSCGMDPERERLAMLPEKPGPAPKRFTVPPDPEKLALMGHVAAIVAKRYAVPVEKLHGSAKCVYYGQARQVAMYLMHESLRFSSPQIGRHFGLKCHSAVLRSFRQVQQAMKAQPEFRMFVEQLAEQVKSLTLEQARAKDPGFVVPIGRAS